MNRIPAPCEDNHYLSQHVALLRHSFRHWTGRDLVAPQMGEADAARYLCQARFALLSHDTAKDPIFNYANQTAMSLFAMNWEDITALPSRMSAEPVAQAEREKLMEIVTRQGFYEHYCGVRIGRHGRRFLIEDAVIWNLLEPITKAFKGQAAMLKQWKFL